MASDREARIKTTLARKGRRTLKSSGMRGYIVFAERRLSRLTGRTLRDVYPTLHLALVEWHRARQRSHRKAPQRTLVA